MATTHENSRPNAKDLQVRLARFLIELGEGQRMPPVRKLASLTQMSVGSVSAALNCLEEAGAVKIHKRGHMGSMVAALAPGELWNLIGGGPLVIALPLPMHSRFEGLATALKMVFEASGIATYCIFIRGSQTRLKALMDNRCHIAVMSGFSADALCNQKQRIALRLPAGSWVADFGTYYRSKPRDQDGLLRVGVDPDSYEHQRLSELEFEGQRVEFIHTSFVRLARLLKEGEVDAVLWNQDQKQLYLDTGIRFRPLSERTLAQAGAQLICAACVTRADNDALCALLPTVVKPDEVVRIQSKVISGEMIPEY